MLEIIGGICVIVGIIRCLCSEEDKGYYRIKPKNYRIKTRFPLRYTPN